MSISNEMIEMKNFKSVLIYM